MSSKKTWTDVLHTYARIKRLTALGRQCINVFPEKGFPGHMAKMVGDGPQRALFSLTSSIDNPDKNVKSVLVSSHRLYRRRGMEHRPQYLCTQGVMELKEEPLIKTRPLLEEDLQIEYFQNNLIDHALENLEEPVSVTDFQNQVTYVFPNGREMQIFMNGGYRPNEEADNDVHENDAAAPLLLE